MPEQPTLDDAVYDGSVRPVREPGAGQKLATLIVIPLMLLLAALVLVFYVFCSASVVDGPSMLDTLRPGDRLLITRSYPQPHRGDVVVATITGQDGRPDDVVKRVVGLPGDTVEVRDDVSIVNGQTLSWPGLITSPVGSGDNMPAQSVPQGTVFLMGDNRPVSYDSRYVGPVSLRAVHGKAVLVFAPIQRMRRIP